MSVQKLISEADKFFEKGKTPEGLAKLKAALAQEPLNQLVATKLANVLLQENQTAEAAKVYGGLAKRLSDAGKNQVAIAIFKQALDLTPDDIALRTRFAQECETVGKLGDAYLQAQTALNYYLRRKKYFDASTILPLMARAQPKDEKIKLAWVEVLQYCQADQKLIHLLVALCGPPGLMSPEFPTGGEPTALSPALYEGIKNLVPFFPRDPKVAYAVAWAAYRRGRRKDFYRYLRECLRRDPDFCLATLLFSRVLAEDKKLNEALFVYRYYKERMTADKSTDMLTLNRLLESFVEKNGWIKFIEDSNDALDTAGFVRAMTGIEQKVEAKDEAKAAEEEREKTAPRELPPAEIELGGMPPADDLEIVTATGQSIAEVKTKKAGGTTTDELRMQAELIKAAIEATIGATQTGQSQQTVVQPVVLPVIQAAAQATQTTLSPEMLAEATRVATRAADLEPEADGGPSLELKTDPNIALKPEEREAVEPTVVATAPAPEPETVPAHLEPPPPEERTQEFSPHESIEATRLSRRPMETTAVRMIEPKKPETPPPVAGVAPPTVKAPEVPPPAPPAVPKKPEIPPPAPPFAAQAPDQPPSLSLGAADAPPPIPATPAKSVAPEPHVEREEPTEAFEGFQGESVEFTSLVRVDQSMLKPEPAGIAPSEATQVAPPGPTAIPVAPVEGLELTSAPQTQDDDEAPAETAITPTKSGFNPLEHAAAPDAGTSLRLEDTADERTQIFSPMDVLDAAKVMQNRDLGDVATKKIEVKVEELKAPPPPEEIKEGDLPRWRDLRVDGEKTGAFSPEETIQAGVQSRRPMDAVVKPSIPVPPPPPAAAPASTEEPDFTQGEPTRVLDRMTGEFSGELSGELSGPMPTATLQTGKVPLDPSTPEAGDSREVPMPPGTPAAQPSAPASPQAFMPIPSEAAAARPGADEEKVDLGEDLLEGPTRIFTQPSIADKTEHLLKEIQRDLKGDPNARSSIDLMMRKAERFTAKRNYYLARKALRHAQALGADEEIVKAKLREIRKLELPDGLYNTISSDRPESKVDTADVLERLEQEFDLADDGDTAELGDLVDRRIDSILQETDPRTILDFGVGLHEMGLFRQAESLFIRAVEEFPEYAFDAYYLAAISKLSRRDYAGAVSILKRLSGDAAKSEQDKIQIYYVLGEAFEKMRQPDRSREFFEKVAEIDANYRNIRHKLDG